MSNKRTKQADDGYDELYADEDMVIVAKKREPLRIEIDTNKLGLRDVLALQKMQAEEELPGHEAIERFLPIMDRCLVNMTTADIPLPYIGRVFEYVVNEVQSMGMRSKNSNGVSPSASGSETEA